MTVKAYVIGGVVLIFVLVLTMKMVFVPAPAVVYRETDNVGSSGVYEKSRPSELYSLTAQLIQQRNNISRQLNKKQQKLGQLACEKLNDKGEARSETGGWCKKASTETAGHHMTDKPLAAALADFFKGKHIASFGDGPGRYKAMLLETGKPLGYDAYDGAPYCDSTSDGRVVFLDLTLEQYGLRLYDWVMSLEVAEHIPAEFESIYIDNIVRHAKEGVVISWAVPGQGGYSHVNNKPFDYVKKLFDGLGFDHDEAASEKLKSVATLPWLQSNTNVFRRRDTASIERMKAMLV